MKNKKGIMLVVGLLMAVGGCYGQWVRVAGDEERGLYLDLDRVWNYNLYEKSRWGAGVRYELGVGSEELGVKNDVFVGYSPYARVLSGGIGGSFEVMSDELRVKRGIKVWVSHELTAAGSRRLGGVSFSDVSSLSSFMSSRMNERLAIQFTVYGLQFRDYGLQFTVGGSVYRGCRLYDDGGMLYYDGLLWFQGEREDGWEAVGSGEWKVGSGKCGVLFKTGEVWPGGRWFARAIGEFEDEWTLGAVKASVFGQAGIVSTGAPYTYMFDLGGTMGAPLFFERSLLTVRPTEFTADRYGLGSLRVETAKPLYSVWSMMAAVGSRPVPFVGINGAVGALSGMDAEGRLTHEGLTLQAPHRGVAEAFAGIDGVVRWGVVDWGVAVARRIGGKEWGLMVTAKVGGGR